MKKLTNLKGAKPLGKNDQKVITGGVITRCLTQCSSYDNCCTPEGYCGRLVNGSCLAT